MSYTNVFLENYPVSPIMIRTLLSINRLLNFTGYCIVLITPQDLITARDYKINPYYTTCEGNIHPRVINLRELKLNGIVINYFYSTMKEEFSSTCTESIIEFPQPIFGTYFKLDALI